MSRAIRYQGAIIRDDHILLVKHREHATGRSYWVIPGGGREEPESEEACVVREMWEETNLRVKVERLLLDELVEPKRVYDRRKTYLCRIESGEAQPGYEPEPHVAAVYAITEVSWFDLLSPEGWDPLAVSDPFTYPLLQKIRLELGYGPAGYSEARIGSDGHR